MQRIPLVDTTAPFTKNKKSEDQKFHVRLIKGHFQNIRRWVSWPMLAAFFGLVWLQLDGAPMVLFSFEQHRILLFGLSLSWHDLPLLGGVLIVAACLLFFLAIAFGRVWCGFACPQSVWTWLFIRIEEFTEGKAHRRARNEGQKMAGKHLLNRMIKHLLWLLLALVTTLTFSGYFVPIREIVAELASLTMPSYRVAWIVIMSALTYLNAGLVREKICLHACPYSRFQAVMFDSNTKTVSYDVGRGEPRGSKRSAANSHLGDCVDCEMCVQVCPTGIDIRDGLQAACIDCGACIDACDSVMKKIAKPVGLVRFASESELAGKAYQFWRMRLLGYGLVMLTSLGVVVYGFTNTVDLLIEIRRDRNTLFMQMDANTSCNFYQLKVERFNSKENLVNIQVLGNGKFELFGQNIIDLSVDNSTWRSLRVCGTDIKQRRTELLFEFTLGDQKTLKESTFLISSQ